MVKQSTKWYPVIRQPTTQTPRVGKLPASAQPLIEHAITRPSRFTFLQSANDHKGNAWSLYHQRNYALAAREFIEAASCVKMAGLCRLWPWSRKKDVRHEKELLEQAMRCLVSEQKAAFRATPGLLEEMARCCERLGDAQLAAVLELLKNAPLFTASSTAQLKLMYEINLTERDLLSCLAARSKEYIAHPDVVPLKRKLLEAMLKLDEETITGNADWLFHRLSIFQQELHLHPGEALDWKKLMPKMKECLNGL